MTGKNLVPEICGEMHFVGNKAKGRISKRVFQEDKAHQIFRKTNISYLPIRTRTCAYQGVQNVRFSENLVCFVFLKHPFWDSPFCLITDDLTNQIAGMSGMKLLNSLIFCMLTEIYENLQIHFKMCMVKNGRGTSGLSGTLKVAVFQEIIGRIN